MVWATAEDVQALTGKVVGDDVIQQATGVIELSQGGRLAALDSTTVSGRNLDWLRRAVAYQAAWMVDQPGSFERMDVTTSTQDGASATMKPDALVLAPLARRCLKRLTWRGMRTIQPGPRAGYARLNVYTSDDYDDSLPYRSL